MKIQNTIKNFSMLIATTFGRSFSSRSADPQQN